VGGVNTAFGFAAFAVFILLGLPKELAALLGTICGVLFNFKTTGTIVFKNKDNRLIFRFFGVYLVAYLLNIGLLDILEIYGVGPLVAGAIIILPVSLLSFLLNKRFVFNALDKTTKPVA
jgi:putative flippase GtrA